MKAFLFPATHLFLSLLTPLAAQNFNEDRASSGAAATQATTALSPRDLPRAEKAESAPTDSNPTYPAQDMMTLEARVPRNRPVDSVVDLAVLTRPSPFREMAVGSTDRADNLPTERVKNDLAVISATYRESGLVGSDCQSISLSVGQRLKLDDSTLLEIVEDEVGANPDCSCEIVKTAIKAADADVETVISIVETSINAAPEKMRIISQCAIATVPESLSGIQALMARYDANAGEVATSSKSAKSSKDSKAAVLDEVASLPNPLDFPGVGPVGPNPGGPGGSPLIPPNTPIIITPPVTVVDP